MLSTSSNFFAQIPDDVILHILSFLDPADLQSIELVSKQLATIGNKIYQEMLRTDVGVWVADDTEHARELFIINYLLKKGMILKRYDCSESGNYFQLAITMLNELPEKTYGMKEYLWGEIYLNGSGVERNPQLALPYFQKSATLGNMNAKLILTIKWLENKLWLENRSPSATLMVKSDLAINFSVIDTISDCWQFLKLNRQTNAKAAYEFARLQLHDKDLELVKIVDNSFTNPEEFSTKKEQYLDILKSCAQEGSIIIANVLYSGFEFGNSILQIKVDQNEAKEYKSIHKKLKKKQTIDTLELLKNAMALGSGDATLSLVDAHFNAGTNFSEFSEHEKIEPKKVTDAKTEEVIGWLKTAYHLKSCQAAYYLGCIYVYGGLEQNHNQKDKPMVTVDINQAIEYFTQGAQVVISDGYAINCSLALVKIYQDPQFGLLSFEKVSHWHKKAALLGHISSLMVLGRLCLIGNTDLKLEPNLVKANEYFESMFSKANNSAWAIGLQYKWNIQNKSAKKETFIDLAQFIKWQVRGALSNQEISAREIRNLFDPGEMKRKWQNIMDEIKTQQSRGVVTLETAEKIIAVANETYKALGLEIPKDEFVDNFMKDFIQEQNAENIPSKGM